MARFNTAATAAAKWSEDLSAQDYGDTGAEDALADFATHADAEDAFVDELKPGSKLLQGQYTIVSYLNSGGFGITYLAKDSLDRTIVIKECFPNSLCRRSGIIVRARSRAHQGEFRSVVRLFVQEARSLSKLAHPNIVGVHQVFEDNDTAYMAIDYVNGKDLLDVLEEHDSPFTPDEVVQMLKKVLGAVDFVHQSGMLHRDISPDNILVDARTKNPVLIDFGAAREQATKASRVMSQRRVVKDGYSPQEFYLTGSAQGPYSDLYALAATFYHVIAGEAPPESQRRLASIAEGSPDPYSPLAGRVPGYPPGFLEAIDKAARVLPKDRLETAAQWLDIIIAAEAAAVAVAAPVAAPVAPTRFARKIVTAPASGQDPARLSATAAFAADHSDTDRPVRFARFPLILGAASVLALGLGVAVWTFTGDPAPLGSSVQRDSTAVEAATALAAADAQAARVAEAQARIALDAQTAAQAQADTTARAVVDATALAAAEASAAAVRDAEATARREARARLEAEAGAKAQAEAAARAEAKAKAEAQAAAIAEAAALAAAQTRAAAEAAAEAQRAAEVAAAAQAKAEAEAAALAAAILPRPPAPDTPLLEDQFSAVRWDYALPFSTEPKLVDGETYPTITGVTGQLDRANGWMKDGVTIFAINGEWVASHEAITNTIRVSTTPDEDGRIFATARIRANDATDFEDVRLVAPATRWVSLKNGTTFRTGVEFGAWRTVVDRIIYSDPNGIQPGDVIRSETTLGKPINAPESLEIVIDLLSFQNIGEAVFEVERAGAIVTARMPLERE